MKALREHALIESAVSSNRMEGVSLDPHRVRDVLVSPKPLFRDRDEEEVRGYREALTLIHDHAIDLSVTEETVLQLHRRTRGEIWDAGSYKSKTAISSNVTRMAASGSVFGPFPRLELPNP